MGIVDQIKKQVVDGGRFIFVTGKAGTGKSTLLREIYNEYQIGTVLVAPTGVAALNIGGETIHSFFRMRPGLGTADAANEALMQSKTSRRGLYEKMQRLIIDEISMVRADLMDCMDIFLRKIRKNNDPFGGVQVICFGDLYQLPPVVTDTEKLYISDTYNTPYFFSSKVVREIQDSMIPAYFVYELEHIYRQSDVEFIAVLNAMRDGTIGDEHIDILNKQVEAEASERVISLVSTNYLAEKINSYHLGQLYSKGFEFCAFTTGQIDQKLFPNSAAITLKEGARVMFLVNDSKDRWVNGSLGTVTGFFRLDGGVVRSGEVEFSDVWDDVGFVDEKVVNENSDTGKNVYGVNVHLDDTGEIVQVEDFTWEVSKTDFDRSANTLKKEVIGTFSQIPLTYAWAITIHKSQGKTFDAINVDLGKGAFASGQAYVALSRCRTLGGVRLVKPIRKTDVIVDPRIGEHITC